jgi:hypothetical protein
LPFIEFRLFCKWISDTGDTDILWEQTQSRHRSTPESKVDAQKQRWRDTAPGPRPPCAPGLSFSSQLIFHLLCLSSSSSSVLPLLVSYGVLPIESKPTMASDPSSHCHQHPPQPQSFFFLAKGFTLARQVPPLPRPLAHFASVIFQIGSCILCLGQPRPQRYLCFLCSWDNISMPTHPVFTGVLQTFYQG